VDLTAETYCRELESYLCRKNDGHLIRIVGPAFEQVCGWAERGVPLKVAQRGIDRYFDRYYAKGPRRRPVRIEFCEADVLDVFDEWRRAVGVPATAKGDDAEASHDPTRTHGSLPAHLDRVIARLTALRGGDDRSLDELLAALVHELDAARAAAKGLRGEARAACVERLRHLDRRLMEAVRQQCDPDTLARLAADADSELLPFRDRMPRDAYERSKEAAVERLIRERHGMPTLTYE
jgi:hypothetical protein